MFFCLLIAKVKKFAKLSVFVILVRTNLRVLNEVLMIKIENTQ